MSNYAKTKLQCAEQSAVDTVSANAHFASAINVPYATTDEQRQWLAQSFPRNYVTFDKSIDTFEHGVRVRKVVPRLLNSEHPHVSFLNDYARNYCYSKSLGSKIVEVGANIDDVIHCHAAEWSVVNSITDAHDELRQVGKLRRPRLDIVSEAKRVAVKSAYDSSIGCNGRFCFNGVGANPTLCEGRHQKADHLISVDSAYDISPKDLGEFMDRRGIKTGTIAMLLPEGIRRLPEDQARSHTDFGVSVRLDESQTLIEKVAGMKVLYYFEGQTNQVAYRHNFTNVWQWLHCFPQKLDSGRNLLIQIEQTVGPLVILELLVTDRAVNETIVFDPTQTVGIKSLKYYATSGLTRIYKIPKFVHQSMMTYMMSNPGCTFKDVVNYYRATKNNFVIAGQRLFEPTNFKSDELGDMLHSLVFSIEVEMARNDAYKPLAEAQYTIHKNTGFNLLFGIIGAKLRQTIFVVLFKLALPFLLFHQIIEGNVLPTIVMNMLMSYAGGSCFTIGVRMVYNLLMGAIVVGAQSDYEFWISTFYIAETVWRMWFTDSPKVVSEALGFNVQAFTVFQMTYCGKLFSLRLDDWKVNEHQVKFTRLTSPRNNLAKRALKAPYNFVKFLVTQVTRVPGIILDEVMVKPEVSEPQDHCIELLKQLEPKEQDTATAEIETRLRNLRSRDERKPTESTLPDPPPIEIGSEMPTSNRTKQALIAVESIAAEPAYVENDEPKAEILDRCPDDLITSYHLREYVDSLEQSIIDAGGKPALKELLVNVKDKLEGLEHKNPRNVRVIWGGPGCGKSTYVSESVKGNGKDNCMWVVSTADNRKEQRAKYPHLAPSIDTVHHSMMVVDMWRPKRVYIDEAFLQGPGVLAAFAALHPDADYYLVGDYLQIEFVDFTKLQPMTKAMIGNFMDGLRQGVVRHLNINYRNPENVVELMNREFGYIGPMKMTATKGPDTFRVVHDATCIDTAGTKIGLYQDDKKQHNGLVTAHECQGNDYAETAIWISPGPITSKANYLRVALTRSKGPTIVYLAPGAGEQVAQFNLDSACHEVQSAAVTPMIKFTREQPEVESPKEPMCNEKPFTDARAIDEILAIDGAGVQKPFAEPILTRLVDFIPDNLRLNVNYILQSYIKEDEVLTLDTNTYARHYDPKDMVMRLKTLVGRYSRNKHTNVIGAKHLARVMFNNVKPYLSGAAVNTFDVIEAAFDTCESMQKKKTDRSVKQFDVSGKTVVDFFHKNQFKIKLGAGPEVMNTLKVGQGIAAHSKQENCHSLILTRAIYKAVSRSIDKRIILYNETDAKGCFKKLKEMGLRPEDLDEVHNDDETEFDASQDETTTEFLRMVFSYVLRNTGLAEEPPEHSDDSYDRGNNSYLDELLNIVINRTFIARGLATMNVQNSKDSGDWETWLGNTLWKIGLTLTRYKVRRLVAFLVGGDDGSFIGERDDDEPMIETLARRGYVVKKESTRGYFEFCGHIYTFEGVLPNPFKLVKKLHTRRFDKDKVIDFAQSIQDVMNTYFASHEQRSMAARALAMIYPNVDDDCARSLISYYGAHARPTYLRKRLKKIRKYSPMVGDGDLNEVTLSDLQS